MRSWLDLFCFGGMSTARRAVLLRVGLLVALVGAFLGAAPSFAFRGTLVAVAPKMNTMLNQDTASVYSNEKIFFTPRRAKVPRDFGGKHPEAIFTALVAGIATYLMSTLQGLLQRQLWVPPFGAVTLIFAADAVAAAKEGKTMCFKTMWQKAWQACIGVAGACFLTVLLARLLGNTPSVLRAVAMFVAALSMLANPQSGYFPPAGALCALYVEKSVSMGKAMLPQYSYALFPCATGVALLLIFCRTITYMAHPVWPFSSKQQREKELLPLP
ncbi:unnamed protein product [Durusdinium trenchii]|uniref:HPP family protein n=1 Tax=Durusdinium trenchii TaxID=1381693 RepID=A0ABP0R4S3_9DINO